MKKLLVRIKYTFTSTDSLIRIANHPELLSPEELKINTEILFERIPDEAEFERRCCEVLGGKENSKDEVTALDFLVGLNLN